MKKYRSKYISDDSYKLLNILEKQHKVRNWYVVKRIRFSNIFLARMLSQAKEMSNFYEQNTVQKMINLQFERTQLFIKIQLYMYLIGFVIPYLYICISTIMSENS